ncbi:excinuclease ABC subunit UvrC [Candidatus Micrarchaeota archaeon]|nr:excinuclease ABC subunit UvrC [Candidatus Micrarchaeota archaeon]
MGKFVFIRNKYPALPGAYIMRDSSSKVLYVGKAKSLRSRLSSYFSSPKDTKTTALISKAASIDFVLAKDEGEALILEQNLIKNYLPRYNILLKDAKHYSYLAVTSEKFPRLLTARKNSSGEFRIKGKRFFGPYTEGSKREVSARFLRKLFRIRVCKTLPKKECLQYHLGNCDAPCTGRVSEEEYLANVDSLISFLEGKRGTSSPIFSSLKKRMEAASESMDFELAASLRDQMDALKIIFAKQGVERLGRLDEDYLWFERVGDTLYVQKLRSIHGIISGSEKLSAKINSQEEPEIAFCMQHYEALPDRVYSNLPSSAMRKLNSAFSSPSNNAAPLASPPDTGSPHPSSDEGQSPSHSSSKEVFRKPPKSKSRILALAQGSLVRGEIAPSVLELKEVLGLSSNPVVIETFDISTLFGESSVGSMVRFSNAKPDKSNYRKFIIRETSGQDDFAMMGEVVRRRYSSLLKDGEPLPDLILIDGGLGQLHSAMSTLSSIGVSPPIISLAKREEEIYTSSSTKPIKLPKSNSALKLLQMCRDEAHRFAISFHRQRRGKKGKS